MKATSKLLALTFMMISHQNILTQNTLPTSGNVGIGTMTPNAELEVNGKADIIGSVKMRDSVVIEKRLTVDQDVLIKGESVFVGNAKAKEDFKVLGITKMKGDAFVEGAFKFKGLENLMTVDDRFLMIKPNGKTIAVEKGGLSDFIQLEAYGYDCKFSGTNQPITAYWKSTPSMNYGILSTGAGCPAKVGIGTDNPLAQLDVRGFVGIGFPSNATYLDFPSGYKLAVNGKIIATGVKVEYYNDWPDYVFEEEYQLMPLEEVEDFIEVNNHLPGIPSANLVGEEGFELQEMDAMLMEKIENLYLYMIELKKENETLKQEIQVLNSK